MASKKLVYLFKEGNAGMKALLGGKGANLAEMTNIGLRVPPGMTITTEACNEYSATGQFPAGLEDQVKADLAVVENELEKKFGDVDNPLLFSVRSGAAISMPGMMDTILNLGLNDETVKGLAKATSNDRFAFDCYRRFIQMFGEVVQGVDHDKFEEILEAVKSEQGCKFDHELTPASLEKVIAEYKKLIEKEVGQAFPQEPIEQLFMAIKAVFSSWNNDRAIVYRKLNKIPDDLGTAVNIQSMVYGNMGNDCGTGVAFTRNPSTGEKANYGEYLINAQGEDVVAGIRTPQPITKLKEEMPEIYEEFLRNCEILEQHYRDMQDIEFTIERGKLYMLQCRSGKRTASAAIRAAVEMVDEGLITKEEAIMRVQPEQLDQLLHSRIDPSAELDPIAKGLPASPGAAVGKIVFTADEAEKRGNDGEKVILVRTETTPDDIHGIVKAQGVLTSRGGMTSHAAVVARGMGKPCVCGCEALRIDYKDQTVGIGDLVLKADDVVTIDGGTGQVMKGEVPMIDPGISDHFQTILEWADEIRVLGVMANADTPEDAAKSREFGADGIGLVRTEHMFMAQERLPRVQEMILAENVEQREAALAKLLPFQQEDFYGILKAMDGLNVIIRLLDPPLHEFLPNAESLVLDIQKMELTGGDQAVIDEKKALLKKVRSIAEMNPMLGHRGCRLGITYPEIYSMQMRAIFQAAAQLAAEGLTPRPEVMIPLIIDPAEMSFFKEMAVNMADEIMSEKKVDFFYTVGACMELPRPCLIADEIAEDAEFFSFGTNDLTQTSMGFSRDDSEGKFLPVYLEKKILKDNPFQVLDRKGAGWLMKTAVEKARTTRPDLHAGICGEQAGEPNSIEFCQIAGLNYVSLSPYRIPLSRLAAAQAAIRLAAK